MNLRPANKEEVAGVLRAAHERQARLGTLDLNQMNRVLEHTPEDMTVTVEAGCPLAVLQTQLATRGQWLPLDPPQADALSVADVISRNWSGPRRFGFGTVRDHLIGVQVALADGRLIRSGGKVVKNVAGFDVMKLFVGAQDSLGIVVEATFKLLPKPETEHFVRIRCATLEEANGALDRVMESPITPSVLDLHNDAAEGEGFSVVLGFSGSYAEVDWQLERAGALGFGESTTLDHDRRFWAAVTTAPHRRFVLPGALIDCLRELGEASFVARAGNGAVYHRGGPAPPKPQLPTALIQRVKDTYDPHHILPPPPAL